MASSHGRPGEDPDRSARIGDGQRRDPVPGRGEGLHLGSGCEIHLILSGKSGAQYSYLKEKGYLPMLAALYENGLFVDDEFREGNVSPVVGHIRVYRRAKVLVEQAGKTIARFRAGQCLLPGGADQRPRGGRGAVDDHGGKEQRRDLSDRPDRRKRLDALSRCGGGVCRGGRDRACDDGNPQGLSSSGEAGAGRSTLIGALMASCRYWVVATNFGPEMSTAQVLSWHQLRGEFENFFKGLKNEVRVGYLPTGDLHANAVFFRIGVLAYNLFIGFKRDLLPASCQTWTLRTVRWRVFSLTGKDRPPNPVSCPEAGDRYRVAFFSDQNPGAMPCALPFGLTVQYGPTCF